MRPILVAIAAVAALAAASDDADASEGVPVAPEFFGSNFAREVLSRDEMVVVAALGDPTRCGEPCEIVQRVLGTLHAKAPELMTVGTIQASASLRLPGGGSEDRALHEFYNLTTAPTLLVFPPGSKRLDAPLKVPPEAAVSIAASGAKALSQALSQFQPDMVARVTRHSLQRFFADKDPFAARMLVFSRKARVAPMLQRLCFDLDRRVVCGQVTVPEEARSAEDKAAAKLAARFGVSTFPAVLMSRGPASGLDPAAESFDWDAFTEPVAYEQLSRWARARAPAAPFLRVRSQPDWEAACTSQGGVCVLFAFAKDGDAREQRRVADAAVARSLLKLDTSAAVGGGLPSVSRAPISYSWLVAEEQPDLMEALGAMGKPAVIAINPKRRRVAVMDGPMSESAVAAFVADILDAKLELREFASLPKLTAVPAPRAPPAKRRKPQAAKQPPAEAKDEL